MHFQDDEQIEILNIFKTESEEIINHINNLLIEFEKDLNNRVLLHQIFCSIHSFKGAVSAMRFCNMQNLLHKLEDVFQLVNDNKLVINSEIINSIKNIFNFIYNFVLNVTNEIENIDEKEFNKHFSFLEDIIKINSENKISPVFTSNLNNGEQFTSFMNLNEDSYNYSLKKLAPLLNQMVEDSAKIDNKLIKLVICENDISKENNINSSIKNVLIHLIRNSVSHGIELPSVRENLGKSQMGTIKINIKKQDKNIVFEIVDDGRGFDLEKIKEKAIKKGYLTENNIQTSSKEDILNIVFNSEFTTQENVSNISGRGLGLDIVKQTITQLNGTIQIFTEENKGSRIEIILPVEV